MMDRVTLRRLRKGVASEDPEVRREAIEALAVLADIPGLLRAARSRDAYLRARAVRTLAFETGLRVLFCLLRAACDAEPEVRSAAAAAFGARGGWIATRVLKRLTRDPDATVRHDALVALAHVGTRTAKSILAMAVLAEEEDWVRRTAAHLLDRSQEGGIAALAENQIGWTNSFVFDMVEWKDAAGHSQGLLSWLEPALLFARKFCLGVVFGALFYGFGNAAAHSWLHLCPDHLERFGAEEIVPVWYGHPGGNWWLFEEGKAVWGGCLTTSWDPQGVCPHCHWPVTWQSMGNRMHELHEEIERRQRFRPGREAPGYPWRQERLLRVSAPAR